MGVVAVASRSCLVKIRTISINVVVFHVKTEVLTGVNNMETMIRMAFLLTLIFNLQFCATVQSQSLNVERLIRREMRECRIPGLQIGVVKDGKVVLLKSFGVPDVQNSVPVTKRSDRDLAIKNYKRSLELALSG
jgi:urea transporter